MAGLRKHWKGKSRQQKYGVIIRKTVLRYTDWVYLWMNLWKDVTKQCCYVSACFFKWIYANPWPSLVVIRRKPAYKVDYTTGLESSELLVDSCDVVISCLDSDGTHSLQRIHWGGNVMLDFSKSVPVNEQSEYIDLFIYFFGRTTPLNTC